MDPAPSPYSLIHLSDNGLTALPLFLSVFSPGIYSCCHSYRCREYEYSYKEKKIHIVAGLSRTAVFCFAVRLISRTDCSVNICTTRKMP